MIDGTSLERVCSSVCARTLALVQIYGRIQLIEYLVEHRIAPVCGVPVHPGPIGGVENFTRSRAAGPLGHTSGHGGPVGVVDLRSPDDEIGLEANRCKRLLQCE